MCAEGGKGASIVYIDVRDNRGAGSWDGNQLEDYADGMRVLFVVEKPEITVPNQFAEESQKPSKESSKSSQTK